MIVDILDRHDSRQFGLTGLFTRVAEPLTLRSEPGEPPAVVDQTDVQIAEAQVVAGLALGAAAQRYFFKSEAACSGVRLRLNGETNLPSRSIR